MWHGPCSGFQAQATNEKVPCGARNAAKVLLIGDVPLGSALPGWASGDATRSDSHDISLQCWVQKSYWNGKRLCSEL